MYICIDQTLVALIPPTCFGEIRRLGRNRATLLKVFSKQQKTKKICPFMNEKTKSS